jgi:hypothetical protein
MCGSAGNGIIIGGDSAFACKKGHVFRSVAGVSLSLTFTVAGVPPEDSLPKTVGTGPLCPYCLADFLKDACGAFPAELGGAG